MVVISLTVWLSFPLKEVSGTNLLLAVCAHKMLWMPCAPHGSHYLANNGFAAGATHSLSNRLHSQLVEVRLKTAQHVVQFINLWLWTLPLGHNLQRREERVILRLAAN